MSNKEGPYIPGLISFNRGIPLDRELFSINNGMRCLQLLTAASVNHVCIFLNRESHLSQLEFEVIRFRPDKAFKDIYPLK